MYTSGLGIDWPSHQNQSCPTPLVHLTAHHLKQDEPISDHPGKYMYSIKTAESVKTAYNNER